MDADAIDIVSHAVNANAHRRDGHFDLADMESMWMETKLTRADADTLAAIVGLLLGALHAMGERANQPTEQVWLGIKTSLSPLDGETDDG